RLCSYVAVGYGTHWVWRDYRPRWTTGRCGSARAACGALRRGLGVSALSVGGRHCEEDGKRGSGRHGEKPQSVPHGGECADTFTARRTRCTAIPCTETSTSSVSAVGSSSLLTSPRNMTRSSAKHACGTSAVRYRRPSNGPATTWDSGAPRFRCSPRNGTSC